jgi:hypothetical protein
MEIDICPRWFLTKLGIPVPTQHHVALLFSTVFVLVLAPIVIRIPHFCLMEDILGIPCPGCGVSHALIAILRFSPAMAWEANPAGIAVALTLGFQLVARPFAIVAPRTSDWVSQASCRISNLAVASLLLVWVLRMI